MNCCAVAVASDGIILHKTWLNLRVGSDVGQKSTTTSLQTDALLQQRNEVHRNGAAFVESRAMDGQQSRAI